MNHINIVRGCSLYNNTPTKTTSGKEYHVAIEARDDGHVVTFAYGARHGTLKTGTKTPVSVDWHTACYVYEKLVASKTAKGYKCGYKGRPFRGCEDNLPT